PAPHTRLRSLSPLLPSADARRSKSATMREQSATARKTRQAVTALPESKTAPRCFVLTRARVAYILLLYPLTCCCALGGGRRDRPGGLFFLRLPTFYSGDHKKGASMQKPSQRAATVVAGALGALVLALPVRSSADPYRDYGENSNRPYYGESQSDEGRGQPKPRGI